VARGVCGGVFPEDFSSGNHPSSSLLMVLRRHYGCGIPVHSANTTQLSPHVPILFVPGIAVDHNIFATPTIELNAIEFFTRSGATCFCITHRVGKTPIAEDGWSTYDARLDVAAALNHITKCHPPGTKVYVVAHCAGSIALSMGLLDGTIPAESIKGISRHLTYS
jgi:hypothetical protein